MPEYTERATDSNGAGGQGEQTVEPADQATGTAQSTDGSSLGLPGGSRRQFLKASAGVGALALGSGYAMAHGSVAEETCTSGETIDVGDGDFLAINNMWGTENVDMCVQHYEDGHYGWEWDRGSTGVGDPNYPEVMVGTKPWGTTTGAGLFPVQFGDVDQMDVSLDVDVRTTGENYNLALEWWHTSQRPGSDVGESITHEIMLVLEWGSQHQHGNMIQSNAFTDDYGNAIDYWTHYDHSWSFHIFRVAANQAPNNLDLASLVDYLDTQVTDDVAALDSDRWVSGIEIGTEYWDDTSGEATFSRFDATVNGQSATSGGGAGAGSGTGSSGTSGSSGSGSSGTGGSGNDTTPPSPPSNLASTGQTATTVDLTWTAGGDPGGSGLAHYNVYVDGSVDHSVSAGETGATVSDLAAGTSYEFAASAVDGAGNESDLSSAVTATTGGGGDSTASDDTTGGWWGTGGTGTSSGSGGSGSESGGWLGDDSGGWW